MSMFEGRGWFIFTAIAFIFLGFFSIAEPWLAGMAVAVLVGWLLIIGGIVHLVAVFSGGGAGRVIWHVILGLLYLVGGFYFLTHPLLGLGSLTLFLATILIMEAVLEFIVYLRARALGASAWMLLNCGVTLFLGLLIWLHWPSSSIWAIGTLVGVNLLMTGFSRLMMAGAARALASARPTR